MATISRKKLHTCITMCQGKNAIQTNTKELKVTVIYQGMKKAPNFHKGHFRASKRQTKKTGRYPCPNVFFELFKPTKFSMMI